MRGGPAASLARRFAWCTTGSRHFLDELPALPESPHHWVMLPPRRIEFDNVERLRFIDCCRIVAAAPAEREAALDTRPKEVSLAWNTSSF